MQSIKGVTETGSILDRIVADLVAVREAAMRSEPESVLRAAIAEFDAQWRLSDAIATPRGHAPASAAVQVIAEVKKASPSKGVLAETIDPVAIARAYATGGAAGISVVTEPNYFQGNIAWLRDVRRTLSKELPDARPSLLRKDFVVHPYELLQARAYGADNVLFIVAMLELDLLRDLLAQARELGLDALVEVHTEAEAEQAIAAGAWLFGINNRDLHTFNVDLATTERIRPLLPARRRRHRRERRPHPCRRRAPAACRRARHPRRRSLHDRPGRRRQDGGTARMNRFLLQMHGESGAGKSTLARAVGAATGAVVLDKDRIKGPLVAGGLEDVQAGGLAYDIFFLLAQSLLDQGHSLVLDCPVYWPRIAEQGRALASEAGIPYYIVECHCGDEDEQERRLTSRPRFQSQPDSRASLAVALSRPGVTRSLQEPHLTVDTTQPIEACLEQTVRYLGHDAS